MKSAGKSNKLNLIIHLWVKMTQEQSVVSYNREVFVLQKELGKKFMSYSMNQPSGPLNHEYTF